MTSLSKYFKIAAIIPSEIIIVIGIILSITHDGSSYKSEWFTDDGFVLSVMLTILLSCFISTLCLTIFLNKFIIVKANTLLSAIAWILLPSSVCIFIIYEETLNFIGYAKINGIYPGDRIFDCYVMLVAILHLTGLSWSYKQFRSKAHSTIG